MASRQSPEINAGSMADIAFLLLIFFLVTTTMNVDKGLTRMLPPPKNDQNKPAEINERNVFSVRINSNDMLLVEGEQLSVEELREKCKEFFLNPQLKEDLSDQISYLEQKADPDTRSQDDKKAVETLKKLNKDIKISKGVISLQNDRGTSYEMYIRVQNELAAAINEVRDEYARMYFGVTKQSQLSEEQQIVVRAARPLLISEAEPKDIGGN